MVEDVAMSTPNIVSRSKELQYYLCPNESKRSHTPTGSQPGGFQPGSEQRATQGRKQGNHLDKDAAGCLLQMVFHFEITLDEMVRKDNVKQRNRTATLGKETVVEIQDQVSEFVQSIQRPQGSTVDERHDDRMAAIMLAADRRHDISGKYAESYVHWHGERNAGDMPRLQSNYYTIDDELLPLLPPGLMRVDTAQKVHSDVSKRAGKRDKSSMSSRGSTKREHSDQHKPRVKDTQTGSDREYKKRPAPENT